MLEAVGHPHAVNPDKELRRIAAAQRLAGAGVHQAGRAALPGAAAARASRPWRRSPSAGCVAVGGVIVGQRPQRRRLRRPDAHAAPASARMSSLEVSPPTGRRQREQQLQDPHVSRVPTRRSTLPTGRLSSGILPGQQLRDARLVASGLTCQRRHPNRLESGAARMSGRRSGTVAGRRSGLASAPGGVGLGGVQQPGVHARCAAVAVAAQVRLVRRAAARGARPRARPATSRRRRGRPAPAARRRGRRSRCGRRTAPRSASSACTTAATSSAGADGRRRSRSRDAAQPVGGLGVPRPAELLVGQRAGGGQRVEPGQRLQRRPAEHRRQRQQLGRHPHRRLPRPRRPRRRAPRPASTPTPRAPRSRGRRAAGDSAVVSGEVRRSPRSRSIASMPSRAAANADGTPSRDGQRGTRTRSDGPSTVRLCRATAAQRVACTRWTTTAPRHARSFGSVADAYDRGRPVVPRARRPRGWSADRRDRARARRRHRQADRAAGRARPRRARHRPRPRDARRAAATACPTSATTRRRRRGDPAARPVGRRRGRAPRRSTGSTTTGRCPRSPGCCKPGGRLALVWNQRDERIPWVRRLGAIIGNQDAARRRAPRARSMRSSALFGFVEDATFQLLAGRRPRVDPWTWCSPAPTSPSSTSDAPGGQARRGARVLRRLRPRHGRHAAALRRPLLPGQSSIDRPEPRPARRATPRRRRDDASRSDGTDTDMLLIDFR